MFVNLDAFHEAMLSRTPSDFVSRYLFDAIPFLFGTDLDAWVSWKTELATTIDVDPRDIVLTGSSALGYSLNPKKHFKAYDDSSDIDCGVISSHHFDLAWRYLRSMRPNWLSLDSKAMRAIEIHRTNYVFSGTIATDQILGLLPFGVTWQNALNNMAKRAPTVGRDIKLRIYRDYDALRQYQARNIGTLRSGLGLENQELVVEEAIETLDSDE